MDSKFNPIEKLPFNLLIYITFVVGLLSFPAHANYPEFWDKSAYAVECKESSLEEVLLDFAQSFGVELQVSKNVGGLCEGWVRAENAVEFLDALAYQYKFEWFVFQKILYISSFEENRIARLEIGSEMKAAMQEVGLYREKFGWGYVEEDGVTIIAAPEPYIELIKQLGGNEPVKEEPLLKDDSKGVYIIPIKHASVVDRSIKIRDKEVEIPGIANILLKVLGEVSVVESDDSDTAKKSDGALKSRTKEKISIHADPRTNSLIIRSPFKKYDKAYFELLIAKLDTPIQMIEIDAIIVEVNKQKLLELGLNQFDSTSESVPLFTISPNQLAGSANPSLTISNPGEFIAELKALEGEGDASIVANTSILTMENQSAIIDLSETVILQTVGERVAEVNQFTTGTLLNVVPQYVEKSTGDKVKLSVTIEDGNFTGESSETLRIIKSSINTTALIDENEALVIAGYHVEEKSENENKVPFLGDIPLVGNLFSVKRNRLEQRERIFILIPRISPFHHRAESYSYFGGDQEIKAKVNRVKKRWQRANEQYVDVFIDAVKQYSHEGDIAFFRKTNGSRIPFNCEQNGVLFEFSDNRVLEGEGISVYIGKAINQTSFPVTVSEKSCFGHKMIGVSYMQERELNEFADFSTMLVGIENKRVRAAATRISDVLVN